MGKKSSRRKSVDRNKKKKRNKSKSSSSSFYSSSSRRNSISISSNSNKERKYKAKKHRKSYSLESDKTEKNLQIKKNLDQRNVNEIIAEMPIELKSKENKILDLNVNLNNDIETESNPNIFPLNEQNQIGIIEKYSAKESESHDIPNKIVEANMDSKNTKINENINNINLNNNLENVKNPNMDLEDELKIVDIGMSMNKDTMDIENLKKSKAKKSKKEKHKKREIERNSSRSRSKHRSREKESKKKSKKEKKSKKKYSDNKRKKSYSSHSSEGSEISEYEQKNKEIIQEKNETNSNKELNITKNQKLEENDKNKDIVNSYSNQDISELNQNNQKLAQEESSLALKADLEKQKEMQALAIRNKLLGYVDENSQALEVYKHYKHVDINSIPNIQKKVIIFNLPPNINDDEIKEYFYTLLLTLNPDSKNTNPIISIEKCDEGFYYIFELATKDDIEILMNMDQTDWRGYKIRIQKPRRFITDYNDTQGNNAKKRENKKQSLAMESDNKLYMGGIPLTAKESEVRELVESFGQLKLFNLVKDPNNEELNRGFCFFEYLDEKVTERALKGLNNIDMADRKLRVQRATINNKSFQILQQMKTNPIPTIHEPGKSNFSDHNPTIQPHMHVEVPIYAALPSRVIQLINMITAEDIMDDLEYREIVEDIRNECMQYGTVLNVEIPRPDKITSIAGPAVGKIFVKFSTLQSAKKARFKLSGKKYNRRTCVSSFYPENYFDVREFNFHER